MGISVAKRRWIPVLCCTFLLLGGCAPTQFLHDVVGTTELDARTQEALLMTPKETQSASAVTNVLEEPQEETDQTICLADATYEYSFYQLEEESERILYRDILSILGSMADKTAVSEGALQAGDKIEEQTERVFQCVLNDHPELFYVDGYSYTKSTNITGEVVAMEFAGTYTLSVEEACARKAEIEEAARAMLAEIGEQVSEYEKVKAVYETIILNTDYDLEAPDNQNIYSVFVGKASVCQGYAKAVQYLLNRLQVECLFVLGGVDNGEKHAWNMVKVDGSYYHLDATWGDPAYLTGAEDETVVYMPDVSYDYLCITTAQLLRTHYLDNVVPVPECVDMSANYYVREGAYFESYDREQMRQLFEKAASVNRSDVTVKCSNSAVYDEIWQALVEKREIFEYMDGSTITYANNVKQLSLTFVVTND